MCLNDYLRGIPLNLIVNNVQIPIEHDGPTEYLSAAAQKLGVDQTRISIVKILSKSLDISNHEQFIFKMAFAVAIEGEFNNARHYPIYTDQPPPARTAKQLKDRPIIVGFGPAGMFAALELVEHGYKPIIFERGKEISDRAIDVQTFNRKRILNPESNVQFGEGGAGSFSDGKLFSRRNNNTGYVNRVLQTFIKFGAPEEIGFISKPHLGTDVLCKIVRNIRLYLLERGAEIHYGSKMTDIMISDGAASGISVNDETQYRSSHIFIALGHSARDTFTMLHQKGVAIEQRPISVGLRIEHPVETINRMRYGNKYWNYSGLGAATYSLNYTNRKIHKGVYTFCMCPGGEIVNASSSQDMLVLNGMSYSRRASPYSNAALVVSCHTGDYSSLNPLAGIEFQKDIERKAFMAGGGQWNVPAQNLMTFLGESSSIDLPETSYAMGAVAADLKDIFPKFVVDELTAAFHVWRKEVPLFVSHEAILLGPETRTSSPIRLMRDKAYESISTKNLFPIGEGAGYTGGITSSAADAIRAVEAQVICS